MAVETKEVALCHVTGHPPSQCPGNDEVDVLAHIQWLEEAPAEDLATWLQESEAYKAENPVSNG